MVSAHLAACAVSTPEGRRRARRRDHGHIYEHILPELILHLIGGILECRDVEPIDRVVAARDGYPLDGALIDCPVRMVWGTEDQILPWPSSAVLALSADLLPHADWVELDGVGHCPQLDVPLETAQLSSASRPGELGGRVGSAYFARRVLPEIALPANVPWRASAAPTSRASGASSRPS